MKIERLETYLTESGIIIPELIGISDLYNHFS